MNEANQVRNLPEKKFGPYASGIGVAVWSNRVETEEGNRVVRSVTINPRRYRDRQTGEWKNTSSYYVQDVHLLIAALEQARNYLLTEPLPETERPAADAEPSPF